MTAEPSTPSNSEKSFLWVNKSKHSLSLSHSQKAEKQRIFSHAQKWQKTGPEDQDITGSRKPRAYASSVLVHRPIRSRLTGMPNNLRPVSQNRKRTTLNQNVAHPLPSQDTTRDQPSEKSQTQAVLLNKRMQPWLKGPVGTNGSTIDPFQTTSVVLNQQTHTLLNYYIDVIWPAVFYFETLGVRVEQHRFYSAVSKLIQDCISSKVDMTTLLAQAASRMENVTRVPVEGGSTKYMHNALSTFHKHCSVKPVVDERLIRDLFHLFAAEGYRFNLETSRRHILRAKELIDQLGGLHKIDQQLMEMLVTGELFVASELMVPSIFTPVYDPGGGSEMISKADLQILWVQSDSARLGEALLDPMQADIVSEKLRMIIADMVECAWVAEGTMSLLVALPTATRWLHLRNMAIRYHLLGVAADDPRTNALRIALLMWILLVMTQLAPLRCARVVARTLHHVLLQIDPRVHPWMKHGEIHAWILCVGAVCAEHNGEETGNWFVEQLVKCCTTHRLPLHAEGHLYLFTKRFFYLERVQRASFRELARKLAHWQSIH